MKTKLKLFNFFIYSKIIKIQLKYLIIKQIKKVFQKQKIIEQYKIEKYFINIYFPEHELGISVDKNEKSIKNLDISLIKINTSEEGFDIFIKIGEIQNFIYESGIKISGELKKNKMIEN